MAAPDPRTSPAQEPDPGLERLRERIDARLVAATTSSEPTMADMASHLVVAGGKRLRPIIAATASVTGATGLTGTDGSRGDGDGTGTGTGTDGHRAGRRHPVASVLDLVSDDAVTGGVAVELVHAGSLHHDDVIDEAETRHDVPSVNARWGNLRAILSGDFLLAKASELAASLGTEVAELLAATIGRLCEGEVRELHFAYRTDRTEEDYHAAIAGKTAALYATAARIGALVAGLPRDRVDALTEFGRLYGMAFQVVDDVLDITSTDEELGKPAGHDMVEGVYTLPVLRCLDGSTSPGATELAALLGRPLDDDGRRRALELVRAGGGVEAAERVARSFVTEALAHLDRAGTGRAAEILAGTARSLVA